MSQRPWPRATTGLGWSEARQYEAAAISEGICPDCHGRLRPVDGQERAGTCAACECSWSYYSHAGDHIGVRWTDLTEAPTREDRP